MLDYLYFAVVTNPAQRLGFAHMVVFDLLRVLIERSVGAHIVHLWVALEQHILQSPIANNLLYLMKRLVRIAREVFQCAHGSGAVGWWERDYKCYIYPM